MNNRFQDKPGLFILIIAALFLGTISSLQYARGDNYLAEASYIFSFFLVLTLWTYFFNTRKIIYLIFSVLFSGGVGGVAYWYAMSSEVVLLKSIMYGALIGLGWMIAESFFESSRHKNRFL